MSKEFIEKRIGSSSLATARRQQQQLSYFTQSSIQDDLSTEYLTQWAQRNYQTDDFFLNFVKNVFKIPNFLAFYKYLRTPLASSGLINDMVKPELERVFHAEDSYFHYTIKGKEVETPEELEVKKFNKRIFKAYLFNHNDIVITDLKGVNDPFSQIVSINNVVALESIENEIRRVAYTATVVINDMPVDGYLYIDDKDYIFYDKDLKQEPLLTSPHDLGRCPADYVTSEAFANDDIVRKSIFSHLKDPLEEYSFLKTIQRMTDPNANIPIATMLDVKKKGESPEDGKGLEGQPMSAINQIGGQRAKVSNDNVGGGSDLQAGTVVKIPPVKLDSGGLDMSVIQNYIKFFYAPIEAANYLNERIKELEKKIVTSIIGELANQNNESQNELQVESGFMIAQDKLRSVSLDLSRIRQRTDYNVLTLKHGFGSVENEAFYGSDFFLDSLDKLYELFAKAPNAVERRGMAIRISVIRNRFNRSKRKREVIFYSLMPYISDDDFKIAIENAATDPTTFQLQSRFNYWITAFEAQFGDIVVFWESLGDIKDSEKLVLINNLLLIIIDKDDDNKEISEEEKIIKRLGQMSPIISKDIMAAIKPQEKVKLIGLEASAAIVPIIKTPTGE